MNLDINPKIEKSWDVALSDFFDSKLFNDINNSLKNDIDANETIYPEESNIFNAFNSTPFNKIKVVILGQDPYHGKGQAHGLSFSVLKGVKLPPSLQNIFKELQADEGVEIPESGDLTSWAEQGVLLLNSILTVRASQPASHHKIGWEQFTDNVIKKISDDRENIVFILWGNYAKSKKDLINSEKHCIIESVHPSPFSAYNGFFGSKPFSKTNKYLISKGVKPIEWGKI